MDTLQNAAGIRESKNGFNALAAHVNEVGEQITVFRNNKPWVAIYPADRDAARRRAKLEKLQRLAAEIEKTAADEPIWDPGVSDKELLGAERVRRFV